MPEPQSLCEARDGALWIVLTSTVAVWADGSLKETIPRPDIGVTHNQVADCTFDDEGGFWMSASGSGVHRYADGRWSRKLEPGNDPEAFPSSMVRSPQGVMVVQTGMRLVWLQSPTPTATALPSAGPRPAILTLHATDEAVFVAGAFGLMRYRDGRSETALFHDAPQGPRINGLVTTAEGDMWLALPRSLVRLRRQELEQAFASGELPASLIETGSGYSLPVRPHTHSLRSIARGGDGRIWIATQTGSVWVDPARNTGNSVPPGIEITSLEVDGRRHRDPSGMTLPAGTEKIAIDFSVLCFSEPERVRVRYMLEGFDRDWVDPGARRQAFYTNLPPGHYRFRVVAANSDGVWNPDGAGLAFDIPPTIFQSAWFWVLLAATGLVILWLLYRLRIARVARRIHARLEERVMERERIARELHDTLLQGVQGLILRFQSAAEGIPVAAPVRGQLDAALAVADDIVIEARNKVQDLRACDCDGDLGTTLEKAVAATPFNPPIPVRIVIEGRPRLLDPVVASEIGRIAREALLNIAHHADSTRADIALGFERTHLALRVRDYGTGIPDAILEKGGKEGHYGLVGMRERAERIGGSLSISSSAGEGTELTLVMPAKVAYPRRRTRASWIRRLLRGDINDG